MKKLIYLLVISVIIAFVSCTKSNDMKASDSNELTIYAYDSFTSEWGPGPQIVKKFEEIYGIKVNMIDFGDAGSVLTKAISEKDNPNADIIIGIDNNMYAKALKEDILAEIEVKPESNINNDLFFGNKSKLLPFDYGYFSIIYNSESISNPPSSLEELTKPEFEKSLILMDPRTSSPGLGFLLWTISVYDENYLDFWDRLKPNILTISDGWTSGYGLFTQGEAPMVLSYTTSPAYHAEFEDNTNYKATIFKEGNYLQLEGVGIIKGASNVSNAEKFLTYLLSAEAQNIIPLTNFMFPVNNDVVLPDSFKYALRPEKAIQMDYSEIESNYELWLNQWTENSVK